MQRASMPKFLFVFGMLCYSAFQAKLFAQSGISNLRSVELNRSNNYSTTSDKAILPATVIIKSIPSGNLLNPSQWNCTNNKLTIESPVYSSDTAFIASFRVLSITLFQPIIALDSSLLSIQKSKPFLAYQYSPDEIKGTTTDFGGLDYRGALSRSILTGNNQDLSFNSNFNLRINGRIDKRTELAAVITDNNIPIQPDGATRTIQEFDKVYIQLTRDKSSLLAGDYEIQAPDGYFMKYWKKLRGATFSNSFRNKSVLANTKGSIAISRGKFARMVIQGTEGNQGPYKLIGSDGENFIIVLAGTEKVWIDGMLLQRGLQDDYVVDYNRGDVSFTPKRLITKDSRIIIEFEYAVQNFVRSLLTTHQQIEYKKLKLSWNVYSERDSKSSSASQQLTPEERKVLIDAGDNLESALVGSIDTTSNDPIRYRLIDTLGFQSVLVYTAGPANKLFRASFSFVGNNNGNYILDASAGVNGRIFKFIAPSADGKKNGNYDPVRKLIAPTSQQLATIQISTPIGRNTSIRTEFAGSHWDKNRFSDRDGQDDYGFANLVQINRQDTLHNNSKKPILLQTSLQNEFLRKNFKFLNPYRNAEFARDYNYKQGQSQENILTASIKVGQEKWWSMQYRVNDFRQELVMKAIKQDVDLMLSPIKRFNATANTSVLGSTGTIEKTNFIRSKGEANYLSGKNENKTIKVYYELEDNQRKSNTTDTLLMSSYHWWLYGSSFSYKFKEKFTSSINAQQRIDKISSNREIKPHTIGSQITLDNNFTPNIRSNFQSSISWRKLQIQLPTQGLREGTIYLGRIQHNWVSKKGNMTNTVSYEIGSGQEQRFDFFYQEVNSGEGQFQYNDYNADRIKQLDEFEPAVTPDQANYVRIILLSNEFIRTDNITLNESAQLAFPNDWRSKKGVKKLIAPFSLGLTGQVNRKLKFADNLQKLVPFSEYDELTQLVNENLGYNAVLYHNRAKATSETQLGTRGTRNIQTLTSGIEGRTQDEYFVSMRNRPVPAIQWELKLSRTVNKSTAQLLESRRFNIESDNIEPGLVWNANRNTRLALKSKYANSRNTIGSESLELKQFSIESRKNTSQKSSLEATIGYSNISFNGNISSPVGFAMTQGLRPGNNWLWNINLDYRLTKKIYLNGGYDGRKLGDSRIIHIVRMQARAEF